MYACMTSVGFDTSDKFENHWSKQNVAKCFCKVRNHAQCFTLNTSGKYHCCFRIKDLNAVSNPKFFHVSIET